MPRRGTIAGRGVLALASSVVLTSCYEAAALDVTPELSGREQFPVAVQPPGPKPFEAGPGGLIETFSRGNVALVAGWAATPDARITVLTEDKPGAEVEVLDRRRYVRRDVAALLHLPPRSDLGFQFLLRVRTGLISRVCVLSTSPAGVTTILGNSDPGWCQTR